MKVPMSATSPAIRLHRRSVQFVGLVDESVDVLLSLNGIKFVVPRRTARIAHGEMMPQRRRC